MKNFAWLSILLWSWTTMLSAQESETRRYTISGYIEDAESGEKLIGANVYVPEESVGVSTNLYGFYSLTLPQDSVYLAVSYIGMETQYFKLYLDKDITLDISLGTAMDLEIEVVASDVEEKIEEQVQMSQISIPIEQIKKMPVLLGEVDVLKTLQLLPGVQSGGEGTSGLYVRGGSPDQNLILLDGVPVYNAYHLFGFFSVFNADAIKNVTITKGGYPARFGGRLSSVLEINMKEGSMKKFHGEGSIGLISSKLTLEGPIWKDKTSFLISGRRTYIDILARPFIYLAQKGQGVENPVVPGYYFYDVNAKINHKFNDKHRLYLSFYGGDDKFSFTYKDETVDPDFTEEYKLSNKLRWGNITSALRWNYLINDKLFSNTTITYSQYKFNIEIVDQTTVTQGDSTNISSFGAKYFSGINDWTAKIDFDYIPHPNHYIRFGASGIHHTFSPGALNIKTTEDQETVESNNGDAPVQAGEFAAYVEDDLRIGRFFRANIGIHASGFLVNKKFYYSVQPRIGMRFMLPHKIALKSSFTTMTQYIHLLTNEGIGLPTDLWVPSTENVTPEQSWQVALGLAKTFADEYEVSIEGYYKDMKGMISYKPGASFLEIGGSWEDRIAWGGTGSSYGMEVFVQKKKGRFTGWLGYTLAWSWRQFEGTDINSGKKYPFKYDRRHDFSVAAMYKFSDKISASAAWVYSSGNALTLPIEEYFVQGGMHGIEIEGYGDKNSFRMGDYHRLDLSIDFHKQHKKYKNFESIWSVGVYNAYSRQNPYFIFSQRNFENKQIFKQVSLLPIVPSVRWNFKF